MGHPVELKLTAANESDIAQAEGRWPNTRRRR